MVTENSIGEIMNRWLTTVVHSKDDVLLEKLLETIHHIPFDLSSLSLNSSMGRTIKKLQKTNKQNIVKLSTQIESKWTALIDSVCYIQYYIYVHHYYVHHITIYITLHRIYIT